METRMSDAVVSNCIHIFFLLDISGSMISTSKGSMMGSPITALNTAVSDALSMLGDAGSKNKNEITVMTHILSFNNQVTWLCGTSAERGVQSDEASRQWQDLPASGGTNTADAINAILPGLSTRYLGKRTYRPIIILISDGESNEPNKTLEAIEKLDHRQKTLRVAIGVEGYNGSEMEAFASTAKYQEEDDMGNLSEPVRRKLVFPVSDIRSLGSLVKTAVESSLMASITMGQETVKDPDGTTQTTGNEDDDGVIIFPVDPEE